MSNNLTRRHFCRGAVTVVGAVAFVTLGPNLAKAQAKMSKEQVSYQEKPRGARQCSNCKLFTAPKACQSVEGDVSPEGWCVIYKPLT